MSLTELDADAGTRNRKPRNDADRTESPRRHTRSGQRLLSATEEIAAVRRAEAEFAQFGRWSASDAEIAARTELSETTVRAIRGAAQVTASLDEPVTEDSTRLGDLIADERAVEPPEEAIAHENR